MRPSLAVLRTVKPRLPPAPEPLYQIPPLSLVQVSQLPNDVFGKGSYSFKRTKFGHWPVYKKIQNTKVSTEIKRIKGDAVQFRNDLVAAFPALKNTDIFVNQVAGYINIKGDVVEDVKKILDDNLSY